MSVFFYNKIKLVKSELHNYNDECLVNPPQDYISKKEVINTDYIDNTIYDNYIAYHKMNTTNTELINSDDSNYSLYLYSNIYDFNDLNDDFDDKLLRNSYKNIFQIIKINNIKSITIPPFGAGLYNFHMKEFASVSIDEINKQLRLNPYIKKITLITKNEQEYNLFQDCLNEKLINLFKKSD
jgi:hypothetical protein